MSMPLGGRPQNGFRAFLDYFFDRISRRLLFWLMSNEFKPQSEQRSPPSYDESRRKRLWKILQAHFDASFGTVWWISNEIAKERLSEYRESKGWDRVDHPYVSTFDIPTMEFVPMLFGTSGSEGPVVARGLTKKRGQDYATSFGQIIQPALLSADEIVYRRGVRQEEHKRRFNDTELAALKSWMSAQNERRR